MRAHDDDGTLLAAATSDIAAFEALYRRYVGRVTAWAVARCGAAEDVGDVVAQTFVRLLRVADRFDPTRGEPAAFMFVVAGSVLRDLQRSDRRQRRLVHRAAGRELLDGDEIAVVEAAIDAARLAPRVEQALAHTSESEEEILRLVADGLGPSDAAAALGISPAAARGRLFRARQRVQAHLTITAEEA